MKSKRIDKEAIGWANSFCETNNKRCEATNKDVNLYFRDAYIAGADSRQAEIDELILYLKEANEIFKKIEYNKVSESIDNILKKYES